MFSFVDRFIFFHSIGDRISVKKRENLIVS